MNRNLIRNLLATWRQRAIQLVTEGLRASHARVQQCLRHMRQLLQVLRSDPVARMDPLQAYRHEQQRLALRDSYRREQQLRVRACVVAFSQRIGD